MAISDSTEILASPLTIIKCENEEEGIGAIIDIINQHQVGQIVAGLPRSMDGSIGQQAEKVRAFVAKLRHRTEVPVEFRDERLTTVSARRLMRATRPKKTRKIESDDAVAAALILQGYLDEAKNNQLY